MNRVTFLIGGNQGDRKALIEQATELIRDRIGPVVANSRVYETEPWGSFESEGGKHGVDSFLNKALVVETGLSAVEVLHRAQGIETDLGRKRAPLSVAPDGSRQRRLYHSRPMDIDIIFYNDEVIDTPELTVPHPRMHLRRFVLEPLNEIIPEYRHPVIGKTVGELFASIQEN